MVIFSGKHFNYDLAEGEVQRTFYGMSNSGWMDQFVFQVVPGRPVLLLDGHSSHYTLELIQTDHILDVIIFCLPPHTRADSQPLDTSVFGPLKSLLVTSLSEYMFSNPGCTVTKFQFLSLFRQTWLKGMSIDNIYAGFKKTGVYPFNPEVILKNCSESMATGDDSPDNPPEDDPSVEDQFTPEQLKLFKERFLNDYDIYTDHDYVAWLQEFHPDNVPSIEAMVGLQCDDNADVNPTTLTHSSHSGSPSPHTDDSTSTHTSGSPSAHTSGSPTAHTNGSPTAHTSGSPSTHTSDSPSALTSGSLDCHLMCKSFFSSDIS